MCRGETTCRELHDPAAWSIVAPLPPPDWVRAQFPVVCRAISSAAAGDVQEARALIATFPDAEARDWCIEHGQLSGNFRFRQLGQPAAPTAQPAGGVRNPSTKLAAAVLQRDQYQCRYCSLPVIPRSVFAAFSATVGESIFPVGSKNMDRHGAAIVFRAQVDHVVPWNLGGATDLENLVTSCWACNFGKDRYHLSQIGVSDPRERAPSVLPWDGLVPLIRPMRSVASAVSATEPA